MRGAVAAGHPLAARAGARILAEGGNAVDACIAAAFAGAVCESPLTGLGAGGFMLVYRARDRSARLADFFVAAPGLGGPPRRTAAMAEVAVGFGDGGESEPFRIGPASVAVPGMVAGLEAAHRTYGALPWRELVVPACELARGGVTLTPVQGHIHAILDPILRSSTEGRRVYSGPGGERLRVGERLVLPDLAETLEQVGRRGAEALRRGALARATVAAVREGGGTLNLADLAAYRVSWRRPLRVAFAGHSVLSTPPPSLGGALLLYGLALLGRLPPAAPASGEALVALVEVMREQNRARASLGRRDPVGAGLAGRLLNPAALAAALGRVTAGGTGAPEPAAPGGTTHVSVLDRDGNAASLSCSTGSGSGVVVPGTGIYLNNMLGELDLVGAGGHRPGERLTSMMAPTVALAPGGEVRLVVGSAGSARLRGAIMQVVVNVLVHRLDVAAAIEAPRVHLDEPLVQCEGGHDPAALALLARRGYPLRSWRRRNLYFGGASAVERLPDGTRAAAGDPRRGGAGVLSA